MLTEHLENRWMLFTKSLGANPKESEKSYLALVKAYDAPTRMYHSLSHIDACLRRMDRLVPSELKKHVEMAVWWHDYVYVPARSDNEDQSMHEFVKHGRRMGLEERFIGDVADMIPYTKHNASLKGMADRYLYLLDVDLCILGEDEAIFDAYEVGVRHEYAFVPDDVFRPGRAKILRSFLARPFIFETGTFRSHFELKARQNLERSVAKLQSEGSPAAGT